MKKLPTAAITIRKSTLNFFLNIREKKPSFAILYPEIAAVVRKRNSANRDFFRMNSKNNPEESSVAERAIIAILLSLHRGDSTVSSTLHTLHSNPFS